MKNKNGITLIALIITVIVMLILAGVALSAISGENGLFGRVKKTAELYNNSVEEEKDAIGKMLDALNGKYTDTIPLYTSD